MMMQQQQQQLPHSVQELARRMLYGGAPEDPIGKDTATRREHSEKSPSLNLDTKAAAQGLKSDTESPAEKLRREAGFSTRYTSQSRYMAENESGANPYLQNDMLSVEDTVSVGSAGSSFRTQETVSSESDAGTQVSDPGARRPITRVRRKSGDGGDHSAVSDDFVDESAMNMQVLAQAFSSVGLSQIAADWAGEVKNAGIDLTKMANEKVQQSFKKSKSWTDSTPFPCKREVLGPFDEEDVAIEVEYLDDSEKDADMEPPRMHPRARDTGLEEPSRRSSSSSRRKRADYV